MAAKLKKNLPKRCTNEKLKARRARSYQRGQQRKAARVAAQRGREAANRVARAAGELTAHEVKLLVATRRIRQPRVRNEVGNFIVDKVVRGEHGDEIIKVIEPCCNAKSFKKCNCLPKLSVLTANERWAMLKFNDQFLINMINIP